MENGGKSNLAVRKSLLGALFVVIIGAVGFTVYQNRPWTVPEEAKQVKNPLSACEALLTMARPLYLDKCSVCHGDTGKGDGHDASLYDPRPTNFTNTRHMSQMTDGELFYKMTEGRRPMPSFRKRLTDEQRWQLVLVIRSFAAQPSTSAAGEP
jgi:mono/diheme cytochrome c family protein